MTDRSGGTASLDLGNDGAGDRRTVPLRIKRNGRARRLILRFDPATGEAVVTCPPWVGEAEAVAFAAGHQAWINDRVAEQPGRRPFADGAHVPYLGIAHRIRHLPGARGTVWRAEGEIQVAGRPEHLPRRVGDWFRREARREVARRVEVACASLAVKAGRITIRDTRSRWGSCAAGSANLSFSWRLVMTPAWVLDYVVAHEVAHIVEHNHGPGFWALVRGLVGEPKAARRWLNDNAHDLHRYG